MDVAGFAARVRNRQTTGRTLKAPAHIQPHIRALAVKLMSTRLAVFQPPRPGSHRGDRLFNPASVSTMSFWQAFKHFLSMQWWITAPLPLKVAYFGLACAVVFGLAAAIAGIEFGREAEDQVVEVTEDLLTIASLGGGPVLVMGLISSFARRRTSGRLWPH
jgi:hypothetical protein